MWERYNEVYHLNARVLPMSMLQADENRGVNLLDDVRYRDRDFVLIDESHNFRHHTSQRYEELQRFLHIPGRKVCLLTATPRNSRALDVYHQIKLFHPEDTTLLPIAPPNLKEYFKLVEQGERRLQDVLRPILIRRRRRDVLRWYGYAGESGKPLRELSDEHCRPYLSGVKRAYVMVAGRHQYFPQRELEALRYSIEDTYNGLYQELRGYLGRPAGQGTKPMPGVHLTYARYGLWHYVHRAKQKQAPYNDLRRAGINLRGLIRTSLFKRFESSVEAFRRTLQRMIRTHSMFLKALEQGFVPAGEDAETLLGKSGRMEEDDLLAAIGDAAVRYDIADFDAEKLKAHIEADVGLLRKMVKLVEPITAKQDAKLQTFLRRLEAAPIDGNKCLIFTQYADTAEYIFDNLNPGNKHRDIEIIFGTDKSKSRVVGRFSPKANPDFAPKKKEDEIRLLVATDVLAEGLNLQDCSVVLNYDLHWNPVRLIQRFGRIDRIGSEHETIYGLNFLPETGLERELGIRAVLAQRIQEIHDTIGEDAAVLDKSERLNAEAMYAIYSGGEMAEMEDKEEAFMDLNEAEEFFRSLAKDDPKEYERIMNLRDGIRSARGGATGKGLYVLCQAGRYNQLFLQQDGGTITRDLPRVLEVIAATTETPTAERLPKDYNQQVMRIKDQFVEEVKHQQAQRQHSVSLGHAQRYVLRELRVLFSQSEDEDEKAQINILERAFRASPSAAVSRELNSMRHNGMVGRSLLKTLISVYHQHRLGERGEREGMKTDKADIPRIVCSEALV
jgi:superfamily II DNA or RNA helicase